MSDLNKIGVFGAKGKLGSELVKLGCTPIDADVTITGSIVNTLKDTNFEAVVNCAAFSDVDGCQENPLKAYRINGLAPQNISDCFSGKIVQISTDYIFDGQSGPYDEAATANPQNTYGFSKFMAELGMRLVKNSLVIRTTILYDNKNSSFVKKVYDKLKPPSTPVTLPELFGNPTYIPHLAKAILYCIEKDHSGIINVSGTTYLSRYEMGKKISEKFGFDQNLVQKGIAWGEAKRGQYMGFVLKRAEALGIPLFSFDDGLNEFKNNVENFS